MSFEEGFFIDTIEQFPCIWNLSHRDHKNKIVLENAWTTIATITDATVEECQSLWKSLRSKYVRERKASKSTPSGSAGNTDSSWHHFQKMGFLDPHIQTRRTKGNILNRKFNQPSSNWQSIQYIETDDDPPESAEPEMDSIRMDLSIESPSDPLGESETETPADQPRNYRKFATENFDGTLLPTFSKSSHVKRAHDAAQLRQQRNETAINKKKRSTAEEPLRDLVNQCSTLGDNVSELIRQNASDKNNIDADDYHFAMSMAASLTKVKGLKKKINLKAKISEEIDEDENT